MSCYDNKILILYLTNIFEKCFQPCVGTYQVLVIKKGYEAVCLQLILVHLMQCTDCDPSSVKFH